MKEEYTREAIILKSETRKIKEEKWNWFNKSRERCRPYK